MRQDSFNPNIQTDAKFYHKKILFHYYYFNKSPVFQEVVNASKLESKDLNLNPNSTTHYLCDPEQATYPLWVLVYLPVKWGAWTKYWFPFSGSQTCWRFMIMVQGVCARNFFFTVPQGVNNCLWITWVVE